MHDSPQSHPVSPAVQQLLRLIAKGASPAVRAGAPLTGDIPQLSAQLGPKLDAILGRQAPPGSAP